MGRKSSWIYNIHSFLTVLHSLPFVWCLESPVQLTIAEFPVYLSFMQQIRPNLLINGTCPCSLTRITFFPTIARGEKIGQEENSSSQVSPRGSRSVANSPQPTQHRQLTMPNSPQPTCGGTNCRGQLTVGQELHQCQRNGGRESLEKGQKRRDK